MRHHFVKHSEVLSMKGRLFFVCILFLSARESVSFGGESDRDNVFNHSDSEIDPGTHENLGKDAAMLNIPLQLVSYQLNPSQADRKGHHSAEHLPERVLSYKLKATLNRPNHFYLEGYHVTTTALYWMEKDRGQGQVPRSLRLKVNVSKMFGSELEEDLGSFIVPGKVILDSSDPLNLKFEGDGDQLFKDKFSRPLLRATIHGLEVP